MRTRLLPVTTVPVELLDAAQAEAGEGVTLAELVRRGLALVAGVDPEQYPVRPGRPRKHPEDEGAAA